MSLCPHVDHRPGEEHWSPHILPPCPTPRVPAPRAQVMNQNLRMYVVCSVIRSCLDSLRPHGLQPTRLLCPQDSPGKDTGVGCHFLLQGIFLTQGSSLGLLGVLYWQAGSLFIEPPGQPEEVPTRPSQHLLLSPFVPLHSSCFQREN